MRVVHSKEPYQLNNIFCKLNAILIKYSARLCWGYIHNCYRNLLRDKRKFSKYPQIRTKSRESISLPFWKKKNVNFFRQFKKGHFNLISFYSHEKDILWLNVFHHIAHFAHGPSPAILFVKNGSKDFREFFSKRRTISIGILIVVFQSVLTVDDILTGNVFYFGAHEVIKNEVYSRFDDF